MDKKKTTWIIISSLLYVLFAVGLIFVLMKSGTYPDGENTMFHIYRADTLLQHIRNGQFFLWYDPTLYNGTELLRYFGVFPAYVMAFIEFCTGGEAINAYLVTTALVFIVSALEIFYIGLQENQDNYLQSFALGFLWFFFPMNLYIWFREGDLAGGMAVLLVIPVLFYNIKQFIRYGLKKNVVGTIFLMMLLSLCEETYAIMFFLVFIIWVCVLSFLGKSNRRGLQSVFAVVAGISLGAFWFIPAISGNIHYSEASESLARSYQSLSISLNPLHRLFSDNAYAYIGVSVVLLAIFQLLFHENSEKASAITLLLVVVLSSSIAYSFIQYLYCSSVLKMLNMCAIATAMLLVDYLAWFTLKKSISLIVIILIAIDSIPSLSMVYGEWSGISDKKRMQMESEYTFISEAKSLSKNRIALLDNSTLSSMGTWLVSGNGGSDAVFGSGWTASETRNNTRMLNQALHNGNYLYMFDRLLSYGADSVIVRVDQMQNGDAEDLEKLDEDALHVGYKRVKKNQDYRLYVYDVNGIYGTENTYQYLAIGTNAENICEAFPSFELGDSTDITTYSIEDLEKYKVIYLAGFTYSNREKAEEIVKKLSEEGIRIIIAADGIPEDPSTHHQNFLSLECQPIQFKYGFPEMDTVDGTINPDLFPIDTSNWTTVYVNGLRNVLGKLYADDVELPFFGTVENDNIYVIGFRLTQFYGLTHDESVGMLLNHALNVSSQELPVRKIVSLQVENINKGITISGEGSDIMIPYAYAKCMNIDEKYTVKNNFLVMSDGTLSIHYRFTMHQIIGWIITCVGIVMAIYLFKISKN